MEKDMERQQHNRTIQVQEICYGIFFALMLFAKGIGLYDGQILYKLFFVTAFFFFACKMILSSYTVKEIIAIGTILLISGISFYISGEKGILICACVVVGMKDISVHRLMKWSCYIWGAAFTGLTIVSLFRLHDTVYKVHDKLGLGHIFRWSLGYPHPNVLHISFLILLVLYLYIRKQKFTIKTFIILFLMNIIIFMYSISYTGFAIVILYLLGNLYWAYKGKLGKVEQLLVQLVLPACITISLAGPILLKGRVFDIVNKILNSRLLLSREFLIKENLSLLGIHVEQVTNHSMTMDNSYVYTFIAYGILPFLLITIGYILLIRYMVRKQQVKELLMILALLIAGLTEPFLFNTSFKNPTLLFLGAYFFRCLNKGKQADFGFAIGKREVRIGKENRRIEKTDLLKQSWLRNVRQHGKKAAIAAAVIAIASTIIFQFTAEYPQKVFVPRKESADVSKESALYLEQKEIDVMENTWVLGYKDSETPMQEFSGNIITLERIRGSIACAGITTSAVFLLLLSVYMWKEQTYNEQKKI